MYSPILIPTMLNLKRPRFTVCLLDSFEGRPLPIIGRFPSYRVMIASSIVWAISLNMSNATWGATLKNSRFCRILRSVNRSMVL